jgi:hypothetical protein
MPVANCPKCNKLFQRTTVPLCPACHQESQNHISAVYRFICDHPNQTTDEIAKQCNLPLKELETILFSGSLGTAAQHVIFHCQRCNRAMSALKRKGHFCPECAMKLDVKEKEHPADKSAAKELPSAKAKPADDTRDVRANPAAGSALSEVPVAPKQESVRSLPDSYGFTRSSENKA